MNKLIVALFALIIFFNASAQDSAANNAKKFIRQGDYNNAILVLNRALEWDRNNIELKKDLAFAYYLSRDYSKAINVIKPVTESDSADVQSFQILGMVYKAIEEKKEGERMYKTALKKFRESGALYNEYGEMLWSREEYTDATRQWQRGAQVDPSYPGNYYNLARFYYLSDDKVWGLIYGEIFINLESYSKRTPEIKSMLLDGYKKLFKDIDLFKGQDKKNDFVNAFLETMKAQSKVVEAGVTTDALTALRTRFILEWFNKYATKFPFKLFEYHRQLAKEGMFDAYNQWIFGAADNLQAFQLWCSNHGEEYSKLTSFQKGRVFKMPKGQFYQWK